MSVEEKELSDELKESIVLLLQQNKKVSAVKLCREALNCSLVEAKALVDQVDLSLGHSENNDGATSGLLSPLGIITLLLILGGYLCIR